MHFFIHSLAILILSKITACKITIILTELWLRKNVWKNAKLDCTGEIMKQFEVKTPLTEFQNQSSIQRYIQSKPWLKICLRGWDWDKLSAWMLNLTCQVKLWNNLRSRLHNLIFNIFYDFREILHKKIVFKTKLSTKSKYNERAKSKHCDMSKFSQLRAEQLSTAQGTNFSVCVFISV